ncbi:MAG: MXAN_2562 family outer membrane beta-barrel protein [Myxococcaceae bacterium]
MSSLLLSMALLASPGVTNGVDKPMETPRSMMIEFKLGPMVPLVDRAFNDGSTPYKSTFGGKGKNVWMLLGEIQFERQLFQEFGTLAAGVSIGYGEKYAHEVRSDGSISADPTSLKIMPLKALASYRFDWLAINHNIPLVPYLKAGLVLMPWWITDSTGVAVTEGLPGKGVNYGYFGTVGLALQLDFLDPRLARDFDTGVGVNHTYLFGEFTLQEVNNFGKQLPPDPNNPKPNTTLAAIDLSSQHWMFGIALEF